MQQQVREAVARPGVTGELFSAPVVETFAPARPAALPPSTEPATLVVWVQGAFERSWQLLADGCGWRFTAERHDATTVVELAVEVFWKRAVRLLDRTQTWRAARVEEHLDRAAAVLDLRATLVE